MPSLSPEETIKLAATFRLLGDPSRHDDDGPSDSGWPGREDAGTGGVLETTA